MLISYYDHLAIYEQVTPQIHSLYKLSLESHRLGYIQFAGDIAYLCAWLISDDGFGEHRKPNPAGLNTIDAYSNNCPIPYFYNRDFPSSEILNRVNNILLEMLGIYTIDVEQIAIEAYLDYVNGVIPVPPEPPLPIEENCFIYILQSSDLTDAERTPDSDEWEIIKYKYNNSIIEDTRATFYNRNDRLLANNLHTNVKRFGINYDLVIDDSFSFSFVHIPVDVYTMNGLDYFTRQLVEIPVDVYTMNGLDPEVDDINKPLTFKSLQDGSTIKLNSVGGISGTFQISTDNGNIWSDYTKSQVITLNSNSSISFRTKADRTSPQSGTKYFCFVIEGKVEAWHNVMSMWYTTDYANQVLTPVHAFDSMFSQCDSLIKAPLLPATTLAENCYAYMFSHCDSLIKAPELPATTLAPRCYYRMFLENTSLINAPELPATVLADSCYSEMFRECSTLEVAPKLPAKILVSSCYDGMFYYCHKLKEVTCYAEDISASSCTSVWLDSVATTGTFYNNGNAIFTIGASGIPTNWIEIKPDLSVFTF